MLEEGNVRIDEAERLRLQAKVDAYRHTKRRIDARRVGSVVTDPTPHTRTPAPAR